MEKVDCNQYYICKNSSTNYCYKCPKNNALKDYFEEIVKSDYCMFIDVKEIQFQIYSSDINQKIEVLYGDLLLIGFITHIQEEYIIIKVNNADNYKVYISKIKQLKIFK
jgi:hypothetical protein